MIPDAPDPTRSAESLGAVLPAFRELSLLGRGGGGAVYAAYDRRWAQRVALKVCWVPTEGARDNQPGERFLREIALLLRGQTCETLVRVFRHGVETPAGYRGALLWYTMELCESSLATALPELPLSDRITASLDLLDALCYLSARGVAHRDLKPANVFVVQRSPLRIKVGDLGIARGVRPGDEFADRLTSNDMVVGTLLYMAPEIFVPDGPVDLLRADQFSAGMVLYELLSRGATPFDLSRRSLPELWRARRAGPAPLRIPDFDGDLSALDRLLQRMLALDPAARFRDFPSCTLAMRSALLHSGLPV